MAYRDHWRRPKLGALGQLYDEGVAAASTDAPCPYDGGEHGNPTRAHIWRQGFEDEQERLSVEALV